MKTEENRECSGIKFSDECKKLDPKIEQARSVGFRALLLTLHASQPLPPSPLFLGLNLQFRSDFLKSNLLISPVLDWLYMKRVFGLFIAFAICLATSTSS